MGICTQSKIQCQKILPIDNPESQKKKSKANKERVSGKILDEAQMQQLLRGIFLKSIYIQIT